MIGSHRFYYLTVYLFLGESRIFIICNLAAVNVVHGIHIVVIVHVNKNKRPSTCSHAGFIFTTIVNCGTSLVSFVLMPQHGLPGSPIRMSSFLLYQVALVFS